MPLSDGQLEWLETNELGSFALGNVDRKLRRKYHALLTIRDPGLGDAWNLLSDVRELLTRSSDDGDESALLVDPVTGQGRNAELLDFHAYPHAHHRYRALDIEVERSVHLAAEGDQLELCYHIGRVRTPLRLTLEPLLRCRPLHALTQENPFLDGTCVQLGNEVRMLPYAGMPAIALRIDGAAATFEEHGSWHPVTHYEWEAARGYPASEALFCPGRFQLEISADTTFSLRVALHRAPKAAPSAPHRAQDLTFMAKLERAAAQFFMRNPRNEHGVVAGFPWFGVRSRDALIALPGLYWATLDWERASSVLAHLASARVNGLVPNVPVLRSADRQTDTHSVDASLLFVRTVQWFGEQLGKDQVERFMPVVCELLEALADGSDPRVRFDQGVGLFTQPGRYALTWMDALIDGVPVTPRAGYAVELDALAYNAAHFACAWADSHKPGFARAFRARLRHAEGDFIARYWDDLRGYLADTHDGEAPDASLRPNQLWALALPFRPISAAMARSVLHVITRELVTPAGLRTLSPRDPRYRGRYQGAQPERDRAYHQGSVWPWLTGLYADALRITHGHGVLAARLGPLLDHLTRHIDHEGCCGQISELFDGDAPHAAAGAPAQAWSVAESYRVLRMVHAAAQTEAEEPRSEAKRSPPRSCHPGETMLK